MSRVRQILAAAALASYAVLAASPSWASGKLMFSLPPQNSTLPTAPEEIVLTFSEEVKPVLCKVVDRNGTSIAEIDLAQPESMTLHIPLKGQLADGNYSVGYRVVGGDGHVLVGAFDFSVQSAKPKAPRTVGRRPA